MRELAKLLEETGLSEIEVERGGVRVRVARERPGAQAPPRTARAARAQPVAAASGNPNGGERARAQARNPGRHRRWSAPSISRPQPGAPPFVKIGDAVTDGTVCIIEAMKTMNPVAAPVAGRVTEILVRDGQPVEFGEPLMRIE